MLNAQEALIAIGVEKGIDYATFPNTTDFLIKTAKLLFPEKKTN